MTLNWIGFLETFSVKQSPYEMKLTSSSAWWSSICISYQIFVLNARIWCCLKRCTGYFTWPLVYLYFNLIILNLPLLPNICFARNVTLISNSEWDNSRNLVNVGRAIILSTVGFPNTGSFTPVCNLFKNKTTRNKCVIQNYFTAIITSAHLENCILTWTYFSLFLPWQ